MLLDTEFLIAAGGDRGLASRNAARVFLAAHRTTPFFISRVSWAEFAEGRDHQTEVDRDLALYAVLEVDEMIAWSVSRLARALKGGGLHIGDNDLWIAATALNFGLPLVSNNKKHFARVPGLDLRGY